MWKRKFQPSILGRGEVYQRSGAVKIMKNNEHEVVAIVEGSKAYKVRIKTPFSRFQVSCTCPYAISGNACKHIAATFLTLDANPTAVKDIRKAFSIGFTTLDLTHFSIDQHRRAKRYAEANYIGEIEVHVNENTDYQVAVTI